MTRASNWPFVTLGLRAATEQASVAPPLAYPSPRPAFQGDAMLAVPRHCRPGTKKHETRTLRREQVAGS